MQPTQNINPITNTPLALMGSSNSALGLYNQDTADHPPSFEPAVCTIDPSIKHLYQEGKIHPDGSLRLETIALPEDILLQPDAVKHIQQFMTTPFVIQGMITETTRCHLRHILKNRIQETAVVHLFEMDFMKKTEPVPLEIMILPAEIFLKLLAVFNGEHFKLIGGEARKSLKDTFRYMVELIQQKPCILSPKKEKEFSRPCPD